MSYLLVSLLALFAAHATEPLPTHADSTPRLRYVVWDQHARDVLTKDWDSHLHDPVLLERAYCLTFRKDLWVIPEYVWRVTDAAPAEVVGATPSSIMAVHCQAGQAMAHLHPNQTCIADHDCVPGGVLANQCFPSDVDRRALRDSDLPFGVVICDRDALVTFWPDQDR